jgi:hypothetical protein
MFKLLEPHACDRTIADKVMLDPVQHRVLKARVFAGETESKEVSR